MQVLLKHVLDLQFLILLVSRLVCHIYIRDITWPTYDVAGSMLSQKAFGFQKSGS